MLVCSVPLESCVRRGNAVHITFSGTVVPAEVHLYKQRRPVRARLPRPLQCARCGIYGHATATCARDRRCLRCGKSHAEGPCPSERPRCLNCQGTHAANEPRCSSWQIQRQAAFLLAASRGKLTRRQALERAQTAAKGKQSGVLAATTTRPGHSFRDALKGRANAAPTSRTGPAGTSASASTPSSAPTSADDPRDTVMAALAAALRALLNSVDNMASAPKKPRPRILQWNVRSLRCRHPELSLVLLQREYDVLAFQETRVREGELNLQGYVSYHAATACTLNACHSHHCNSASHVKGRSRASLYVRAQLSQAAIDVRPELFAPLRYFPTPAIVAEIAELCTADFTMRELRSVLDSRKRRSAPGSDGITYQMLRNIDSSLLPQLLAAYNTVWRTGELPASGPTSRGREVRASVQSYINAVDYFVSGIGLELSAEKTEALLVHPNPLARYQVARLSLRGCQLPWQRRVRYLGLTIDHRLSWKPAIAEIRKGSRNIARVASCVLAGGKGCSPVLALRLYNAVATARTLYSVQLVGLNPIQWESLDVVHRGAVRRIFALPRTSPVGPTLAETNQLPLSLRAKAGALRHVHRMHQTQQGQQLAIRLLSRPNSGMGRHALEYAALVPEMPHCGWLPIPPHRDRGLEISTTVPGGHDPRTPFTTFVRVSDEARLIIARHVRSLHPDARVASGTPPRVLPRTGLNRRARAFLLRLRIGCSRTADRLFRLSGSGNPKCVQCPADETIDHILLQCPGYDDHRRRLFGAFSRLGLPHLCLDELLFPSAQHSKVLQAFYALLDFFGDADLFTRL
ncbi:hypothetical protein HPB52_010440 [Rhipicephalus sanguineus]|uniref:Tick transposon n=1 Tax=Rhipicephalus sanguineus TaxID=34632 RepID=A0A9D4T635_RHISA|nr:hypothetical protein HPB52_010440 [Rhipicephalus sanguineus]